MLYKPYSKEWEDMEINFENRSINTYREIYHQTKRIQESTESVVPDTDDDIGRIASVQSTVTLKSKDITGRGVLVSGEASASLLYITEDQQTVSFVRLSKAFSIEYEIADISADTIAQIKLSVLNAETRIINPRKVSITFELAGELSCFRRETLGAETLLPESECQSLHAKYEELEPMFINAAGEKTFAVSEQFSFPAGKPAPARIVSQQVDFNVAECQLIGSKIIAKGSVDISLCYLSEEVNYPIKADFSTPFSQIMDIGEESMELCTTHTEMTSAYFNLTDTINGDKVLDAEVHAVMQIVCRSKKRISYISDVYSNLMPAECRTESRQFGTVTEMRKIKLSCDERISVGDDCTDVLSAFVSIAHISQTEGKLSAAVNIDTLYRANTPLLSSARKTVNLEGECSDAQLRVADARLCDVYLRPDGQFIDAHMSVELSLLSCSSVSFERVSAVELNEQECFDLGEFPSVTLVKVESESLWELAKTYHSSIEKIRELNELDGDIRGRMLLIPKSL